MTDEIEIDYRKKYDALIERARIEAVKYHRGYEIHHIVPRSLGGSDAPSNLVKLWPNEHLRAHWFLTKFLVGSERLKMERVYEMMLMERADHADKHTVRRDALEDAETYGAMPANKRFRKESLSRAATKFLASETSRKDKRPLYKH